MKKTFWISERRAVPALRRVLGSDFVDTGDDISKADPRVLASLIDQGHAEVREVEDPQEAPPQVADEPQLEPEAASGGVSIPFVITKAMRKELRAAGRSEADIDAMTPQEAHAALNPAT